MSDSEYSSEDDEDYVPDAGSDSDVEAFEGQEGAADSKGKAPKKKQVAKKKRKGGIKLENEDDDKEDSPSDEENEDETEEEEEEANKRQEEEEKAKKARMEDLWASFKSDTAKVRAKPSNTSTSTKATPSKAANTNNSSVTGSKKEASSCNTPGKSPAAKVTITKTFDFAGEAVIVTKTVDANSTEAKASAIEQQEKQQQQQQTATNSPVNATFRGTKRLSGLGSVLGQLGKKPKISTLEKSKLDWDTFKTETGISDDLKNFNKNGYLEKQDFLQRTDLRLFEREKEARDTIRKQQR